MKHLQLKDLVLLFKNYAHGIALDVWERLKNLRPFLWYPRHPAISSYPRNKLSLDIRLDIRHI